MLKQTICGTEVSILFRKFDITREKNSNLNLFFRILKRNSIKIVSTGLSVKILKKRG